MTEYFGCGDFTGQQVTINELHTFTLKYKTPDLPTDLIQYLEGKAEFPNDSSVRVYRVCIQLEESDIKELIRSKFLKEFESLKWGPFNWPLSIYLKAREDFPKMTFTFYFRAHISKREHMRDWGGLTLISVKGNYRNLSDKDKIRFLEDKITYGNPNTHQGCAEWSVFS